MLKNLNLEKFKMGKSPIKLKNLNKLLLFSYMRAQLVAILSYYFLRVFNLGFDSQFVRFKFLRSYSTLSYESMTSFVQWIRLINKLINK